MKSCSFSFSMKFLFSHGSHNMDVFLPYLAIWPLANSRDCWRLLSPWDQTFLLSPVGNKKGRISYCSFLWPCLSWLTTLKSDAGVQLQRITSGHSGLEGRCKNHTLSLQMGHAPTAFSPAIDPTGAVAFGGGVAMALFTLARLPETGICCRHHQTEFAIYLRIPDCL